MNNKVNSYIVLAVFVIIFAAIFFLPSGSTDENNAFDYARITDVDYKAVVVDENGSRGKVIITERLTFDIHAASSGNLFWELWRDLPEEYVDGVKVEYRVKSVKQIKENGKDIIYDESPRLYWDDYDYINTSGGLGAGKWYHSKGPYDEAARQYECVLFYVDGLYREKVVFEIEYEMYNATLRYNDCSELYVSLFSGEDVKHLKSFRGQFLIPKELMPAAGNYSAYTYGTNSNCFPFIESDSLNNGYHTFMFELDKSQLKFKPYNQYIEFVLISFGSDRHIFTQYAEENIYYNTDVYNELLIEQAKYQNLPVKYRTAKTVILSVSILILCLTFLLILSSAKKAGKKYRFYEPSMKMEYFRDIPSDLDPVFAATLVFCKHKGYNKETGDGYSSVMLSLARKGYIELERVNTLADWEPNNVRIEVKHYPMQPSLKIKYCPQCGRSNFAVAKFCTSCATVFPESSIVDETPVQNIEPLTQCEEMYLNLIVRNMGGSPQNSITVSRLRDGIAEDFQYTDSFVKNIRNTKTRIGVSEGYFQQADYKKPRIEANKKAAALGIIGALIMLIGNLSSYQTRLDLAFGAFFILGAGLIAGAFYLGGLFKKLILLTQFGEDEYAKWRGLYNFLNSETLMNERTVVELIIWEKYLVYATAFGISDKVIKAISVRCTEANMSMSPVLGNYYFRTPYFYAGGSAFRTASSTASYTARSGSHGLGGSGGGYGGGGRGGGGGGGGH